jgi:hypothetical protein
MLKGIDSDEDILIQRKRHLYSVAFLHLKAADGAASLDKSGNSPNTT